MPRAHVPANEQPRLDSLKDCCILDAFQIGRAHV